MQMSTNSKHHCTDFVFPKSSCNFMQLLSGASRLGCQVTFSDCQVPFPWAVRCCVVSIYRQSDAPIIGLSGASFPGCQVPFLGCPVSFSDCQESFQTVRCLFLGFSGAVCSDRNTQLPTQGLSCASILSCKVSISDCQGPFTDCQEPLYQAVRCLYRQSGALFQANSCPLSG